MSDSYGDGWNDAVLTINGAPYFLGDGSTASICVPLLSCNLIEWTPGAWDGETSWTLGSVASGANGSGAGSYGDCGPVCEDGLVSVTAGGGAWQGEVSWTISACDGSVILSGGAPFDGCVDVSAGYSVSMVDSYGDGWNGNILTIGDAVYGLEEGAAGSDLASCAVPGCMDPAADNYSADANTQPEDACEYTVVIEGCMDASACNYSADANTEPEDACNYALEGFDCDGNEIACADTDNGEVDSYGDGCAGYAEFPSWCGGYDTETFNSMEMCCACGGGDTYIVVNGCMDPNAENYSADANTEPEDACEYALVQGCMDVSACNYSAEAEFDNGTCEYAAPNTDCDGICIATCSIATMSYAE